jgi:dTDP-4-dehydrorhamnose reductase
MRILVLGATGMLGQALMDEGRARGFEMRGAARTGADYCFDIRDDAALLDCLDYKNCGPDMVINAAAMTDLKACEQNPGLAYEINARPVSVISKLRLHRLQNAPSFVQISTDHFFTHGFIHYEDCDVDLVNEYARTKYTAEQFTLLLDKSLVIRTNIVGFRGSGAPTFAEWAMAAIENDEPMTMFEDYHTSSIDVWSFSKALFDVLALQDVWELEDRILNIASSQVANKREFIERLALRMGKTLTQAKPGSVRGLAPRRATQCGLNTWGVEKLLGRRMPDLNDVINALVERRNQPCINPLQSMAG